MPKYHVILNQQAGTAGDEQRKTIEDGLHEHGASFKIHAFSGIPIDAAEQAVKDTDCQVLVAAGGDGTVNAVASVAIKHRLTFGVVPSGTLNHFARDTGIPSDAAEAISALMKEASTPVDYVQIGEYICLNNVSIGLYPKLVRRREERQKSVGKWPAVAIEGLALLRQPLRRPKLEITLDGRHHTLHSPLIFIGNNDYASADSELGGRTNLTTGRMSVFIAAHRGWLSLGLDMLRAFAGRPVASDMKVRHAKAIAINNQAKTIEVAIDGEVQRLTTPIQLSIQPKSLNLIGAAK